MNLFNFRHADNIADILDTDKALDAICSYTNADISLVRMLEIFSKKYNIEFTSAPEFKEERVCAVFTSLTLKQIMDSISCLYDTTWEKTRKGYKLNVCIPDVISSYLSNNPTERKKQESIGALSQSVDNLPKEVKSTFLNPPEGKEGMPFNKLPKEIQDHLVNIFNLERQEIASNKSKEEEDIKRGLKVQDGLINGLQNSQITIKTSQQRLLKNIEIGYVSNNTGATMTYTDIIGTLNERKKRLNSANTYSYEKHSTNKSFFRKENLLTQKVSLSYPKRTHPEIIYLLAKSTKGVSYITMNVNISPLSEQRDVHFTNISLFDAMETICALYTHRNWELRSKKVIVLRLKRTTD